MDNDLRVSLVAAGAAALLSALVGVIARVAFLTLTLRAVVGGLAIGAAVYGGAFLLRKAVPGLIDRAEDPAGAEASAGEAPFRGANVDIVLPGEDAAPESFAPAAENRRYFDESPSALAASARGKPGIAESDDEASDLSPVDEESLLEPEGATGEAAAIPSSAGPERDRRSSSGFEDLDTLPDLEGFSDTFTASEFGSGGSSAASPAKGYNGQGGSGQRPGQEGLDPAALAQAVRTILKRDQKG